MLEIEGLPQLIQAGMGAHISCGQLANETARLGALGVVSGIGLRHIIIEEIKAGDALALELAESFPLRRYVDELLAYAPGGSKYKRPVPMDVPDEAKGALPKRLSAICAYIEVMRAKRGHRGVVGINVMWKCALTALPTIYGAMLAGVDALLCGAGVPMELPDIVRRIRAGEDLVYQPLTGTGTHVRMNIAEDRPAELLADKPLPKMMPILSNFAFCKRILDTWAQKYNGAKPDAFILEHHAAGGHNAPPRDRVSFGEQDDIETYFERVRALGRPVYVAGAFPNGGSRGDFLSWLERGAHGLQVGSRFALCAESGLEPSLRTRMIELNAKDELEVVTDNRVSPTGYPFKFVRLEGTLSDQDVYQARQRICNLGSLLQSHFETQEDGTVKETYVCPAMPPEQYVRRGGDIADTPNRVCLCNAMLANTGYGPPEERPLVTLGESGRHVKELLTARQVMEDILTPEYVAKRERDLRLEPVASAPPVRKVRVPQTV